MLLVQGKVAFSLDPFLLVWGVLLLPTFLLWTAFVAAVFSLTRSRYATYAVALAVFIVTGYFQFRDKMNWVGNWNLWDVVRWSDLGPLELDRTALVLNRVMALGLAALFVALAVRFFPRRAGPGADPDPPAAASARPRAAPAAAVRAGAAGRGSALCVLVERGPQGGGGEKEAKDYWQQNLATWKDAPLPDLAAVELDLELEPAAQLLHRHRQLPPGQPRRAAAGAVPADRRRRTARTWPGRSTASRTSPRTAPASTSSRRRGRLLAGRRRRSAFPTTAVSRTGSARTAAGARSSSCPPASC